MYYDTLFSESCDIIMIITDIVQQLICYIDLVPESSDIGRTEDGRPLELVVAPDRTDLRSVAQSDLAQPGLAWPSSVWRGLA